MFNIDLINLIDELPEAARITTLYSVVGSLNARVLYGAQRIVRASDSEGFDLHEEVNTGFIGVATESAQAAKLGNQHDWFETLITSNSLRLYLRGKLAEALNQPEEEVLPLSNTLKFMTEGEVKTPPKEVIEQLAIALDTEGLDANELTRIYKMEAARSRGELAAMKERVLTVSLSLPEAEGNIEASFDHLPKEVEQAILEKTRDGVNKARNNVVVGILRRSSKADLGDIPLINAAIKELDVALAA